MSNEQLRDFALHCRRQIEELRDENAKLRDALDQLVRFCEMMDLPDDLRTVAKARAALEE